MRNKLLLILLALCLLLTVVACDKEEPPPTPDDDTTQSTPGTDDDDEEESTLRFTYVPEGSTVTVEVHAGGYLYVKGTGAVPDVEYAYDQLWYEHGGESKTDRSDLEGGTILVKYIIVEEGITEIGENAFREFNRLETVSLPSTLKTIGYYAFAKCPNLHTVTGGNGVTTIEAGAFRYCNVLNVIELSDALTCVEESAFDDIILPGVQRTLSVKFKGAESAWQALIADTAKVGTGNQAFLAATVTYVTA